MKEEPWGVETSLDIYNCNPETIRSAEAIREYAKKLVELIEMKAFGEPIIVHFGEDDRVAGYSLVQLIETSLISGHFANQTNRVYINIFSCKRYDVDLAVKFTCEFFGGTPGDSNDVEVRDGIVINNRG